jgi:hypothetical protein
MNMAVDIRNSSAERDRIHGRCQTDWWSLLDSQANPQTELKIPCLKGIRRRILEETLMLSSGLLHEHRMYTHTHTEAGGGGRGRIQNPNLYFPPQFSLWSPQGPSFASKGESMHSFLYIGSMLTLPMGLEEIRGWICNRFCHGETSVCLGK